MKRSLPVITAALALLAAASVAFAGDDVTSLSYISYLERYATLQPSQTGETLDVVVNMPVLAGDRLTTSRGARVEVQLADGSTVWVDEFSTMDFDALAFSRDDSSERSALYLAEGTAAVEIPATALGSGTLRLDSPAGTIFLNRPGLYRLELRGDEIRVQAFSGLAELPVGVGSAMLRGGEEATVTGSGDFYKAGISDRTDDFWNWVQERRNPSPGPSAQHVDTRAGDHAAVLDSYGDWVYVDTFSSWMWRPRVTIGWAPYSYGRWYWTPVGWNWISYEPWGWYPFHYGSWYLDVSFGWVWGWDSIWSPAWVHWFYTPGYVGWCPRGYYDWWYYHNCSHCWGDKWMHPGRWSEVAFDFSGRVRMGEVDPRPWTVVPAGQFGNTHLERVRLDSSRFLRDLPGDRTGVVRTGPMVTSRPSRGQPERSVEAFFRQGVTDRDVPDLSSVLRREPVPKARGTTDTSNLRPSLTRDLEGGTRVPVTGPTTRGGTDTGSGRGGTTTRSGGVENPPTRSTARPEVQRGGVNSGSSVQPPVERRPVARPATQGTRSNQPREDVKPPSRNEDSNRGSTTERQPAPTKERQPAPTTERQPAPTTERQPARTTERKPAPAPAERPPAQARERAQLRTEVWSRLREGNSSFRQVNRTASSAQPSTSASRREVLTRTTSRARGTYSEARSPVGGADAQRSSGRSGSYRAAPVSRAPATTVRSAPSHVSAGRTISPVSSAPRASTLSVRSAPSNVSATRSGSSAGTPRSSGGSSVRSSGGSSARSSGGSAGNRRK
jgi:hypothetical protein